MAYDSLTGKWIPPDSAGWSEIMRKNTTALFKKIYGPGWPVIETPIRDGTEPTEGEAYGWMEAGLVDSAVKVLKRELRRRPDKSELLCSLADIYATQMAQDTTYWRVRKWFRKAESTYRLSLQHAPKAHRTNHNLGLLYIAYGSRNAELSMNAQPLSPLAWSIGMAYGSKAQDNLERAYVADPRDAVTTSLLDQIYSAEGLDEQMKRHMFRTIKKRVRR